MSDLSLSTKSKLFEPRKRALTPQEAAGLASVSDNGKLPYGRRFPVPTSRDCRDLQMIGCCFGVIILV
jgi:hypothetical protein